MRDNLEQQSCEELDFEKRFSRASFRFMYYELYAKGHSHTSPGDLFFNPNFSTDRHNYHRAMKTFETELRWLKSSNPTNTDVADLEKSYAAIKEQILKKLREYMKEQLKFLIFSYYLGSSNPQAELNEYREKFGYEKTKEKAEKMYFDMCADVDAAEEIGLDVSQFRPALFQVHLRLVRMSSSTSGGLSRQVEFEQAEVVRNMIAAAYAEPGQPITQPTPSKIIEPVIIEPKKAVEIAAPVEKTSAPLSTEPIEPILPTIEAPKEPTILEKQNALIQRAADELIDLKNARTTLEKLLKNSRYDAVISKYRAYAKGKMHEERKYIADATFVAILEAAGETLN